MDQSLEELKVFVEASIQECLQAYSITYNEHGEIGIRRGSAAYYVRPLEASYDNPPRAELSAILVWNIQELEVVFKRINELNGEVRFARLHWDGSGIWLLVDASSIDLSDDALLHLLFFFAWLADKYDSELQEEFGGSVVAGEELPPQQHIATGYLYVRVR